MRIVADPPPAAPFLTYEVELCADDEESALAALRATPTKYLFTGFANALADHADATLLRRVSASAGRRIRVTINSLRRFGSRYWVSVTAYPAADGSSG